MDHKEEKRQYELAARYIRDMVAMGVSYPIMEGAVSDAMDAHIRQCEVRASLAPIHARHKEEVIANKFCNQPGNDPNTGLYHAPIVPWDSIISKEHPEWPTTYVRGSHVRIKNTGKEVVIASWSKYYRHGMGQPSYAVDGSDALYYHCELDLIRSSLDR